MLALLTLNYHSAPLTLREQVAFPEHTHTPALAALRAQAGVREAAILSTCNRVEVVAEVENPNDLLTFLAQWHGQPGDLLTAYGHVYTEEAAARHFIRVACGLESLVPGEMQILGQVKAAYASARAAGTAGATLTTLFERAIAAGKRARTETGIARRPVSLSHAAVVRLQAEFGTLSERKVVLIGSGKMGTLAAHQLRSLGATQVMVVNRTLEKACELARHWQGRGYDFEQLPELLAEADAVIAATGAPHLILHRAQIETAMTHRPHRPLLLIDLAVPRDIDPTVADLPNVTLCDVDGLQAVVAANIALRNGEREAVEAIIAEELDKWRVACAVRGVAPTISTLRSNAEEIRTAELEKAYSRLRHLSEADRAVVDALTRGLVNKLLHNPTVRLKANVSSDDGEDYHRIFADLFALTATSGQDGESMLTHTFEHL